MNYAAHYERLIERARGRQPVGYSEKHHVIPRCMGGGEAAANKVRLTAEEHYVAHQLLVRMYPGNHRLLWAAVAMTNQTRLHRRSSNKLYGWLRREFGERIAARNRGQKRSPESIAKTAAGNRGKKHPHSEATKAKMSVAAKGHLKSASHRAALSRAKVGVKRGPHNAEWAANQRAGILRSIATRDETWKQDPKYRAARSLQMKEVWTARKAGKVPAVDRSWMKSPEARAARSQITKQRWVEVKAGRAPKADRSYQQSAEYRVAQSERMKLYYAATRDQKG